MAEDDKPELPVPELRARVEAVLATLPQGDDDVQFLPARDVVHRTLLHLPRFDPASLTSDALTAEVVRIGAAARSARLPFADRVPRAETDAAPYGLDEVPAEDAQTIHRAFHYIATERPMRTAFGLYPAARRDRRALPAAIATLSEFDLGNVAKVFPALHAGSACVVSRVYAFPSAPRNSLSRLLKAARDWLKANDPDVRWLVTYVNPNLGFTAASYKADNWQLIGRELFQAHYDMDGNYVTPRLLEARRSLGRASPGPLSSARFALAPLFVLARSVSGDPWRSPSVTFTPWEQER
jgi:hypothetical protein